METNHKAWGGALAGLVTTGVAVTLPWFNARPIDPEAVVELENAVLAVLVLLINGLFGFLVTYYAPRNRRVK